MRFTKQTFRRTSFVSAITLTAVAISAIAFTSCQYGSRTTRRSETYLNPGWPKADVGFDDTTYEVARAAIPVVADAEYVDDDELCLTCHKTYTETFAHNVHRAVTGESKCEQCHGPASRHLETRGLEPGLILSFKRMTPAERSAACIQCHEQDNCSPGSQWATSRHAQAGLSCTDCHNAHYNVPAGTPATTEPDLTDNRQRYSATLVSYLQDESLPSLAGSSNNLGIVTPDLCYQCHGDKTAMEELAGPHQIDGPNGFDCTTCHNAHGQIIEYSRKEMCLECHKDSTPTMAWHSSIHDQYGVACTDCHNPHPSRAVEKFAEFDHDRIKRPVRRAMQVQDPEACYKCHQKMYGLGAMPSHHPIKEGKMVCSDCHDPHGQLEGNLKAETLNLLCWKCHAEKQGPFVYEHPPVTENCAYCHEPHGTVADNLLRQPTTFLCLRCHSGHRAHHSFMNIDTHTDMQPAFYTDCTMCHTEIHGSDLPSPRIKQDLRR